MIRFHLCLCLCPPLHRGERDGVRVILGSDDTPHPIQFLNLTEPLARQRKLYHPH